MSHLHIAVSINGKPVAGAFFERLISLTVNDKEGVRSDSIDIELNDGLPFLKIPTNAIIQCWIDGIYQGSFEAQDPQIECLPYKMTVSGKATDMKAQMKEQKSRHWDDASLKDVLGDIAGEHGLELQIDADLGSYTQDWWGQQGVSDLHFVEQLKRRHEAIFTIKDNKLIFAKAGAGISPAGAALGELVITPPMVVVGTMNATFSTRGQHKKVAAEYQDRSTAERKKVEVDANSEAKATHVMRHVFKDEAEAKKAAKTKAGEMTRSADTLNVTIEGGAAVKGGGPCSCMGFRPGIDGVPFVIETAAKKYTKAGGLTCAISAKAKRK